MAEDRRWPRWVYADGHDPDARFTLANERTFLAAIRTSLAFLAAGVAVDTLDLDMSRAVQRLLAALLLLLGLVVAAASWVRWARTERALRRDEPLPASLVAPVLTFGLILAAALLMFLVV